MAECSKCGSIPKEIFYYIQEITRLETKGKPENYFPEGKITFRKELICENCAFKIINELQ